MRKMGTFKRLETYFRKSGQTKEEEEIEDVYIKMVKRYIDKHKPLRKRLWNLNINNNIYICSQRRGYISISFEFSSEDWAKLIFDSNDKLVMASLMTEDSDSPTPFLEYCLNYLKKLSIMLV
jgi:hypothetical protein